MRKILSPLRGFESPFGVSAAALSIYAVNNFDPALVFDFDDEYYRTSNSTTTFESAISHNSTSTTNGTMVDSDGLIKWRPHNLALNSAAPATQSITVISGADYTIECTGVSIAVSDAGTGTVTEGNPVTITASTTTLTLTVTGSTGTMWAYRSDLGGMVNNPDRGDSYVPTTTAARYLPRRGHHVYNGSTWVNEGLLHESEARTNKITQSNDLSSGWSIGSITYSKAFDGPLGTNSATQITVTAGASNHWWFISGGAATGDQASSVFAKAGTVDFICLASAGANADGVWFDLSTGTVGTENGSSVGLTPEDYGDGWYRCTAIIPGATFITAHACVSDAQLQNFTATGTETIFVSGFQLEAASTPSSYIPTNGATATRGAETLTVAAADLPYDSTNISIQMDGRVTFDDTNVASDADGGVGEAVFHLWKSGTSAYIETVLDTDNGTGMASFVQEGGGARDIVSSIGSYYTPGVLVPYNISSRHGSTFINGAVDGTALTEDTTPTALPDLSATDLNLGYDYMGTIRTFRMWNKDLTDEGIEEAST